MAAEQVDPHIFVIFGSTGDLTRRKLLPALYRLLTAKNLKDRCIVLGTGRSALTDDQFSAQARDALIAHGLSGEALRLWCGAHVYYQSLGREAPEDYENLARRIAALEEEHGIPGNRVFYLSMPPAAFPGTIARLGDVGLNRSPGWTRLVVEKPFGQDLASAIALNELAHRYFDESQVYRIDHYLGKETVQNLLVFRFSNAIFESLWNREKIEKVEIIVSETLGVEQRAGYYDRIGALRDMVQNHLAQLLTLVAMEVPVAYEADAIRHEKVKVLRSIRALRSEQVVFGQYAAGKVGNELVPGYREDRGVAPDSSTETFVALRAEVDNWRWQGVPFFLTTGKRLPQRLTKIVVTFREPPVCLFENLVPSPFRPNVLEMTLQPDEGFTLGFEVKVPGEPFAIRTEHFRFQYGQAFGDLPEAYQTLILEILRGDQTLFVHAEEVEASWRLFTPLLEQRRPVHLYPAGSWGPEAAKQLRTPRKP